MDSDADKTRMIRRSRPEAGREAIPSENADINSDATRIVRGDLTPSPTPPSFPSEDDDATRLLNQPSAEEQSKISEAAIVEGVDSDKTQLMRRSPAGNSVSTPVISDSLPGSSIHDPVTGWFVIVAGPGKGSQVAVGEQDNRVGRGGGAESARVCLDYGDVGISRSNAFIIRYDPKKRKFKILPGEGTNIVYVNDEDLDSPSELKAGDIIELSETKLRFIPFCGDDFDWVDTE